jgi:hypothetical protein
MSADEYCVFSLLLQVADFRSGMWRGSGVALSAYLKTWSIRKCQRTLQALAAKDYISLRSIRGKKGNYPVIIHKFHEKVASNLSPLIESDDTTDATLPKVTTPTTTIEEVTQENCKTPLPPVNGGKTKYLSWWDGTIEIEMGRKRRVPNLDAYQGGGSRDVIEFLNRRGFPARLARAV